MVFERGTLGKRTLMRQHGMSSIPQQHRLPTHIRPLAHRISIIQPPLPRVRAHAPDDLAHGLMPALILLLQVVPIADAGPTLLQIAQPVLGLSDERNHVHGLVLADGEHQEVLVLAKPAHSVRVERPEGLDVLEGEEAPVRDASTVPRVPIGDELLADIGVDAISANEQVNGGGSAVVKGSNNFASSFLVEC
jgi:hypothetical protein